MVNILLCGFEGKMGQNVLAAASSENFSVAPFEQQSSGCDVVLDFSHPSALDNLIAFAKTHRKPLVIATTGYTREQEKLIADTAKTIPVFRASNFSISVYKFTKAAAAFAKNWDGDIEIVETHHNLKKDAPSGTALTIANAILEARGKGNLVLGRTPDSAKREAGDIGISSVRGGVMAGMHEVRFYSNSCEVCMYEREYGKQSFAGGALKACEFMVGIKKAGLYGMDDLIKSLEK